jgi:hypothetical protein
MNMKKTMSLSFFTLIFITLANLSIYAQGNINAGEKILSPAEERFEKASDLISPWRESGCLKATTALHWQYENPDCTPVSGKQSAETHFLTLYNSDESIWYGFSLNCFNPAYFRKKPKQDFLPLATGFSEFDDYVVLRMTGESKHWYEVEVNEQTRAVKYVLKSDPTWAKTTWDYWLFKGNGGQYADYFLVGSEREMLRDKPNGKVIERPGDFDVNRVDFLKADGEWAYVRIYQSSFKGWLRWRKGREFLVGCAFNNFKVPETMPDLENPSHTLPR